MEKKVLVTGGLGFIGLHLVNKLIKKGDIIDIVDNLTNNSIEPSEISSEKVKVFTCSVEDFELKERYDEIYHLASPVGPAGVLNYAGTMGPMILNDVIKIAKYASKNNSRVMFVSTSEVYGKDPGNVPQKEEIDKIVPNKVTIRLEYGVAKMLEEICVNNFSKYNPLNYNIVRPFNIVGIGQSSKAGFVLPRFVNQALKGEDITIFGDGSQRRTFTHVMDIVDAMIMVMDSDIRGEIFNIGNPANEYSIKEVAEIVKEMINSESKIIFTDPKKIYGDYYEEAWNKIPDIEKIKSMMNWRPKNSFREIVQEVIEDHKKMMESDKIRPNQEP